MKREKDEKIMGPMFPRIHVNDTDKGGPRAPPRNKMALYEQLTIPSNRFNHSASSLVHPSSQYHESKTSPAQVERKKNVEDDHFTVPIFVHSLPNQEHGRYTNFNHQLNCQNFRKPGTFENGVEQEVKSQKGENFTDVIRPVSTSSTIEKTDSLKKQTDSNDSAESEHCVGYKPDSKRHNTSVLDENVATLVKRNETFLSEDQNILLDGCNKTEFQDGPCGSRNTRSSDSLSENSVVDSVSGQDVTPDDVVGMVGQKYFWEARRKIINQQRIFSVQVFELHRLIKVQRSIAASPHVLLDGSAYSTKPTKASPVKRKPLGYPVKDEPEKPIHNNKSSSKNATEKTPLPSVRTRAVSGDYNSGPWCFNPPPLGNQWLVPVMSPSEGLVYKPYPGPGLLGPDYGLPGSNPLVSNFPSTAYPHTRAGPHGYLPIYGMPIMNASAFSGSCDKRTNGLPFLDQISSQYLNLSAIPGRESRASPDVLDDMNTTSEDIEAQASIASSSVERLHDYRENKSTEVREVLPLFPTSPPSDGPGQGPKLLEPEYGTRVIKVVPHNAGSASESAARIFKSIQEGRKQCDWV